MPLIPVVHVVAAFPFVSSPFQSSCLLDQHIGNGFICRVGRMDRIVNPEVPVIVFIQGRSVRHGSPRVDHLNIPHSTCPGEVFQVLPGFFHLIPHFCPVVRRVQSRDVIFVFTTAGIQISRQRGQDDTRPPCRSLQKGEAQTKHLKLCVSRGQHSLSIDMVSPV
jgi:hypothetical protein